MRIVYMGTPEFAVAPLNALIKRGYNIVGAITVPDRQKGRGLHLTESDVKKYVKEINSQRAESEQIPILQPEKLRDPLFLEQLQALNADLFIVVAFRMLPECVWQMPPMGTFNLHASLLPKYRGAAPINWAIINGESESGVTTFLIDKEIDTGKILLQQKCSISADETVGTLHDKLKNIGAELVVETVEAIQNKKVTPIAQASAFDLDKFKAPKLNVGNCTIDWNKTACEIDRLVRGLSPYPAALTTLRNGDNSTAFKIFETRIVENPQKKIGGYSDVIGSVSTTKDGELFVRCSDGYLQVTQLQMSGKKRMDSASFLRGFRDMDKCFFG